MDLNSLKMGMIDKILAWFYSLSILMFSGIAPSVGGVVIAIFIAMILVSVDFITGIFASKREGRAIKIRSKRMRWSMAKLLVYSGCIAFTLFIGMCLNAMELSLGADSCEETRVMIFMLYCVRVEAYFICWIEIVSIIENMRRRYPTNLFLKFLHYIVAVEFVKKIPKLENFLKEEDIKPYNYEDNDQNKVNKHK